LAREENVKSFGTKGPADTNRKENRRRRQKTKKVNWSGGVWKQRERGRHLKSNTMDVKQIIRDKGTQIKERYKDI